MFIGLDMRWITAVHSWQRHHKGFVILILYPVIGFISAVNLVIPGHFSIGANCRGIEGDLSVDDFIDYAL